MNVMKNLLLLTACFVLCRAGTCWTVNQMVFDPVSNGITKINEDDTREFAEGALQYCVDDPACEPLLHTPGALSFAIKAGDGRLLLNIITPHDNI